MNFTHRSFFIGVITGMVMITAPIVIQGCATQTYTATPGPDGETVTYTLRESTLPGMKLEGRRGGLHSQWDEDGSLVELNRAEEGLDTTSQLDSILAIANIIAGASSGSPSAAVGLPPTRASLREPVQAEPTAPAIDNLREQLLSATETQASILSTQKEIIGAVNRLAQIVSVYMIYNE